MMKKKILPTSKIALLYLYIVSNWSTYKMLIGTFFYSTVSNIYTTTVIYYSTVFSKMPSL